MASSRDRAVSVVVPVYNTEPYLRQCLDSIVRQTLRDIEIICVDDGSTDGSLAILREYEAADDRVRVLQQCNQFAGAARNAGMDVARGDYLVFWDSDDFFDPDALRLMYKRSESSRADVCVCGANRFLQQEGRVVPHDKYLVMDRVPEGGVFNRHSNPDYLLSFTTVMVWNKMYRRTFLKQYGLRFQTCRNAEDVCFSVRALCLAERIAVVDERLVNYRVGRPDSLVSTLGFTPTATAEALAEAREALKDLEDFPDFDFFFKSVSVLRHSLNQLKGTEGEERLRSFLRDGGLRKLGISGRPVGYYAQWLRWLVHRR